MSESQDSLKKIVMAGFGAGKAPGKDGGQTGGWRRLFQAENPQDRTEDVLSLLELLPADALREIRDRLDGLIEAAEQKAPDEAVESIKSACLNPPDGSQA